MSRELWARYVLGLMDESVLRDQPEWVQGVEGLDAALRPTYWDELAGATGPDWREIPDARLIRTPQDSEEVAASWLRYFGFFDARPTPPGPDGGVDVEGVGVVAQVKAEAKPTGRPVIQQTYGIAASRDAATVVFSLGGYTPEAVQWADVVGAALFRFDLQGEPEPANSGAERLVAEAERAVRRQASLEPVEIGPYGSERVKNALSQKVIEATDGELAHLKEAWIRESDCFGAIDRRSLDDLTNQRLGIESLDRDTRITSWITSWMSLRRVALGLLNLALLMDEIDLPPQVDPVLPELIFVVHVPDLRRMAERYELDLGWDDHDVARWMELRSQFQADQAVFDLGHIDPEVVEFVRRAHELH